MIWIKIQTMAKKSKSKAKRVIIVGATSGIGQALACEFIKSGHIVAGCGRRLSVLEAMRERLGPDFHYIHLDLKEADRIKAQLEELAERMGGLDLCIVSSGISRRNKELQWDIEEDVLTTNIMGYSAALIAAANYFMKQGSGHLAGITSLAKYFGNIHPAYCASKAFGSIYLQGLNLRLARQGITVSEIMPGFIETPLIADQPRAFWTIPSDRAARIIVKGLSKKKRLIVVPWRWNLIRLLVPHLPQAILKKVLA